MSFCLPVELVTWQVSACLKSMFAGILRGTETK